MSEHGANLQMYNQELVKCLENLKVKRCELLNLIKKEEAERILLEKNLKGVQEKLALLNSNLQQHKNVYDSYDRTIKETEAGFKKILESSQMLLNLVQREANKLENTVNKTIDHDKLQPQNSEST